MKTEALLKLAQDKLQYSYAPYSKFNVAAVILTPNDEVFFGVNVENCAYGLSICAEASAICNMINSGVREISKIIVISSLAKSCFPCGACRQRIFEFSTSSTEILVTENNNLKSFSLSSLLPQAFKI